MSGLFKFAVGAIVTLTMIAGCSDTTTRETTTTTKGPGGTTTEKQTTETTQSGQNPPAPTHNP
jgi:hypothetical protein